MMNPRLLECAVSVRMTCCRAGLAGASSYVPVVSDGSNQEPTLTLEADASAQKAADVVAAYMESNRATPGSVSLGDHSIVIRDPATLNRASGRMSGVVTVITGGARGFGRGIAQKLASEGALVAITDVNDDDGQSFAADLEKQYGAGAAIYVHADVTDLTGLREACSRTLAAFGGIDVFIANAGILIAGSLEEMEETSFDAVNAVNYKGFFLSTKAVAKWMKLQHEYNSDHFMDIVQINSKSGLVGSSRNFAYAGSKFGCIGLVQSFAIELVDHNIKVNAVCPGNYFDGPLWSDPDKGLFVQYLNAGKVPGAKTVEDVKAYYASRVPMGRGCAPEDIATAIMYLRDQKYETGQALPVTGGQEMLS
jgi:sorbitol-6-phosphate 2-dehydrogenase